MIGDALDRSDLATLQSVVDWDKVSPLKHRFFAYEMRLYFGRKVKSAVAEAMPQDALEALKQIDHFKPNIDVTMRVHVEFAPDANSTAADEPLMFLVGQDNGIYKVAMLTPTIPMRHE